jgi:hypothetical protein
MDQPLDTAKPRPGHRVAGTLLVLGTVGITGAAAWLYFRSKEGALDAQTRDRLRPRKGAGL